MPLFDYWANQPRQRALMTRDEVSACIDYELMSKGVLRVEPPVLRPIHKIDLPTTTFYMVKAGSYTEVATFTTIEQAQAFIALCPVNRNSSYECGAKVHYADEHEALTITPVQLANKADYTNAIKLMKENVAAEKANTEATDAFNKDSKVMDRATEGLFDDWMQQQEVERKAQKVWEVWGRYLDMADGNVPIAAKFLLKAYSATQIQEAVDWLGEDWQRPDPLTPEEGAPATFASDGPGSPMLRSSNGCEAVPAVLPPNEDIQF